MDNELRNSGTSATINLSLSTCTSTAVGTYRVGREAVSFLVRVKECIEAPERMLIDA